MLKQARRCCFISLLAMLLSGYSMAVMAQREPIIFGDLTFDTALTQNRIAQYIIEKGYGWPTDVVDGNISGLLQDMTGLMQSLRQGETDVIMELWLSISEGWQDAFAAGDVVSLGASLDGISQSAFMMPAYVQAAHPELDSIEDLKEDQYQNLFATPESGGKARLVNCPASWPCHAINQLQIDGYDMTEHIHIFIPETEAAMNSDLFDAYAKGQPWLGYLDDSMSSAIKLDMVQLEEPPYSDLCWATTKDCAYEDATVIIAARPQLLEQAPEVSQMLRKWELTPEIYGILSLRGTDSGSSHADTAIWWLDENEDIWRQWVTADAAAAIRAALDRGERAEGWPGE